MGNKLSKILIETVVRKSLKEMKENPDRSLRNLVDMALDFSDGSIQKRFFQEAQAILKNENSAYYTMLRNILSYVNTDHLFTFGINMGYNSCISGAEKIRENEKRLKCPIPWAIAFQTENTQTAGNLSSYQKAVEEGESLGIHTYIFFPCSQDPNLLPLMEHHPDSVFFMFCDADQISPAFLDALSGLHQLMPVIRYRENTETLYTELKKRGLLYSVYYPYSEKDAGSVLSGDLFIQAQQMNPVFTVLLAASDCPDQVQTTVSLAVKNARSSQLFQTIPLEYHSDYQNMNSIISDTVCFLWFDAYGIPHGNTGEKRNCNLFTSGLSASLQSVFKDDLLYSLRNNA